MKVQNIISTIALLSLVACFYFGVKYFTDPFAHEAEYKIALKYFRTVTVAVEFDGEHSKGEYLGYSKSEVEDIALKKVTDELSKEFGKKEVLSSKDGQPYDFKSNPLNVALVFHLVERSANPPDFSLHVNVKRTEFFSSFIGSISQGPSSADFKAAFNSINSRNVHNYTTPVVERRVEEFKRLPGSLDVHTNQELSDAIEMYSQAIVKAMRPELSRATKAENFNDK
jgi:hypothetical protein